MKQVECKATSNEEENVIFYFRRKNEKREDTQCEDRRKTEVEWWGEECRVRGGKRKEREGPGLHIEELQNFNTERSCRRSR